MFRRHYNLPDAAPRITTVDGSSLGIKTYGADNGYPQRMINLYNASGSAKMCANLYASFLIGRGFEDLAFYNLVINENRLTPDKLLRRIASDKSKLRGFSMHINYNASYQIESIGYIPFEHCRFGIEENDGKIAVYKDWYNSWKFGKNRRKDNIDFINRYNPDPIVIQEEVDSAGGWDNYKGQVLYHSDDFEAYPLAVIDPVLDDVQAEIESANTRKNNLKNNFQLKNIWVEKGEKIDEENNQEVVDNVRDFMGAEGKPVMVIFSTDPDGKDVPTLVPVQSGINDKLFQYTDQAARLAIYTQFGQPAVLHSDYLGASGFNEGQLPQSKDHYNDITEPDRILFEEIFTELFSNFKEVVTTNYKITPLKSTSNANTFINTAV